MPLAYVLVSSATTKSVSLCSLPHAPSWPPCKNHVPKPPKTKLPEEDLSPGEVEADVVGVGVALGVV
jgi:hypothetical protein